MAARVPVTLEWRLDDGILALTATTPGRGERSVDAWSMTPSLALDAATAVEGAGPRRTRYVSRAAVAACLLTHDTTYTFSYAIVMRCGKSIWVGSNSVAVTIGPAGAAPPPRRPNASFEPRPSGPGSEPGPEVP